MKIALFDNVKRDSANSDTLTVYSQSFNSFNPYITTFVKPSNILQKKKILFPNQSINNFKLAQKYLILMNLKFDAIRPNDNAVSVFGFNIHIDLLMSHIFPNHPLLPLLSTNCYDDICISRKPDILAFN